VLMALVLYEHFYTEHLRGHHVNVGLANDPATARFGERYWSFLARTVPAQLRHAWRLERERLQSVARPSAWRWLRNRIVQGWIGEACIVVAILTTCGSGALVLFVAQAALAVGLLEATNFYEHWGLQRTGRRPTPADAWDTNSWFTLYGLVGLSRHADHHVSSHRPYEQLRYRRESPKLPYGYLRMDVLAMFENRKFQCLMSEELRRRRLGPFAASDGLPERAKRAE
jgi:alkane 1-monooxygenase